MPLGWDSPLQSHGVPGQYLGGPGSYSLRWDVVIRENCKLKQQLQTVLSDAASLQIADQRVRLVLILSADKLRPIIKIIIISIFISPTPQFGFKHIDLYFYLQI
jgi:hypothetical protein